MGAGTGGQVWQAPTLEKNLEILAVVLKLPGNWRILQDQLT